MKAFGWFKDEYEKVKDSFEFKLAELETRLTEKIISVMTKRGINRSQLAEKMGVSKPAISKLLNNGSNITLRRALSIAEALGCEFDLVFHEKKRTSTTISITKPTQYSAEEIERFEKKGFTAIIRDFKKATHSDDYRPRPGEQYGVDAA